MIDLNFNEFLLIWGGYALVWIGGIAIGYTLRIIREKKESANK